jgi:hypothetical protein
VQGWEEYDEDMTLDDLITNGQDFLLFYQRLDLTAAVCKSIKDKRAASLAVKEKKRARDEDPAPSTEIASTRSKKQTTRTTAR